MKVISINNTDSNTFKGLWEPERVKVTGTEIHCIHKQLDRNYHPFKGESLGSINDALESKKYTAMVPTVNDYEYEYYVSLPKEAKCLSFTEKEFLGYKKFYGKNLPEAFKNIEKELAENGLARYINGGFFYSVKKFLHNIKLV